MFNTEDYMNLHNVLIDAVGWNATVDYYRGGETMSQGNLDTATEIVTNFFNNDLGAVDTYWDWADKLGNIL